MIVNTEVCRTAEYIGDIQENTVGIDKENVNFITSLLTSNLYSNPLESFFRETVSNAHDSHVESGSTHPIILLIEETPTNTNSFYGNYYTSESTYTFSIRDYGVGVSPERFEKIYKNIGSSTKRESNDFIGMLGIGRFSCLSCANVANINSYYNGIKYSYMMYKNGNGINIDKVSEDVGDYKNGLEVSVSTAASVKDIEIALNKLCFFDNLKVVEKNVGTLLKEKIQDFNNRRVKHYKNFSTCSLRLSHYYRRYAKMGNVLYPLDTVVGEKEIDTKDVIIHLPMGSVDITPNRESLQYTDFTKNTIKKCLKKVKEELQELASGYFKGNVLLKDLLEVSNPYYSIPYTEDLEIKVCDVDVNVENALLNGHKVPFNFLKFLNCTKYSIIPKCFIFKKVVVSNARSHRYRGDICFETVIQDNTIILEKTDKITKAITTEYYIDKYKDTNKPIIILSLHGKQDMKNGLMKHVYDNALVKYPNEKWYQDLAELEKMTDFFLSNLNIIQMCNSSVPEEYIKNNKKQSVRKTISEDDSQIRVYCGGSYRIVDFKSFIKYTKGLILYSINTKDDATLRQLSYAVIQNIGGIITIKKELLPTVINNRKFMSVDEFLEVRNKIFTKLATAKVIKDYYAKEGIDYKYANGAINYVPPNASIYIDFRTKYDNELTFFRKTYRSTLIDTIINKYIQNRWLNYADINYYTLSDNELEAYALWKKLYDARDQFLKTVLINKFGRIPKIGLDYTKLIYNIPSMKGFKMSNLLNKDK